jgi:hypothetical protein
MFSRSSVQNAVRRRFVRPPRRGHRVGSGLGLVCDIQRMGPGSSARRTVIGSSLADREPLDRMQDRSQSPPFNLSNLDDEPKLRA